MATVVLPEPPFWEISAISVGALMVHPVEVMTDSLANRPPAVAPPHAAREGAEWTGRGNIASQQSR